MFNLLNLIDLKPVGVGDSTSKSLFTLESLCLGLNLSVILLLGFDIVII